MAVRSTNIPDVKVAVRSTVLIAMLREANQFGLRGMVIAEFDVAPDPDDDTLKLTYQAELQLS